MQEPIRRMKVEAEKREEDVGESASFSSDCFVLPDDSRVDFPVNSPPDSPVSTFDVIFEII